VHEGDTLLAILLQAVLSFGVDWRAPRPSTTTPCRRRAPRFDHAPAEHAFLTRRLVAWRDEVEKQYSMPTSAGSEVRECFVW